MFAHRSQEEAFARLSERLASVRTATPELLSELIATACTRLPALKRTRAVERIFQLIEAGAWTDAALALIEAELPQWKLRRIEYDSGTWHCSLSRQPELPAWLDQSADAHHEVPALAILDAFVEARRSTAMSHDARPAAAPKLQQEPGEAVCCDNFA